MTTQDFAKKVSQTVIDAAKAQDDPKNRTITKIGFSESVGDDGLTKYTIILTSSCDGWAEDSDKPLVETYEAVTFARLQKYLGLKESFLLKNFSQTMENTLVIALEKLFSDAENFEEAVDEADDCRYAKHNLAIANTAEEFACGYLITDDGRCNWDNIIRLRKLGYSVFAGDQDSFGWLTGCIAKDGNVLVYG